MMVPLGILALGLVMLAIFALLSALGTIAIFLAIRRGMHPPHRGADTEDATATP
jgi:hypothetical protein